MPIYTNDPFDDGLFPVEPSLRSSIGIGPKVTKAIDAATKDWLDKHPEATTTVEDNSLTNAKFMDGSVNSRVIENESITTDDIADLAITTPKIADNAVTTPKMADNAVTADKVASSAVDGLRIMSTTQLGVAKVGAGLAMNGQALELDGNGDIATAVTSWLNAHPEATTTVQDGAITTPKLADEAVTDDKMANSGVKRTAHKLWNNLVSHYNKNRFDGTVYSGYLNSSGDIIVYEDWVSTDLIYVGDVTHVFASGYNVSENKRADIRFNFLCTYDANGTFIEQVASTYNEKYTVESGVEYIRFSYHSDIFNDVQVEPNQNYKTEYVSYDDNVLESYIRERAISLNKQSEAVIANTNKKDITSDFTLINAYIDKSSGNAESYADGRATDFISLYEYSDLYVTGSSLYSISLFAIYDERKELLYTYQSASTTTDYHVSFSEIVETYPTAAYVRFSSLQTVEPLKIKRPYSLGDALTIASDNKWFGKKWTCMGDSLTEHNIRTTLNYHDYIAEATGITVVNMGYSGTGYKRGYDNGNAFYQRIANVPLDSDVVTIFGSGNDLRFITNLGNPDDVFDPDHPADNSLCACINKTIDVLIGLIPTVQLGIVSPTPWIDNKPTLDDSNSMGRYSKALKEICYIRSIPFLDLYHESNLRPWTEEGRAACYTKDEGNGVHPDETGHALIAPRFLTFLESLIRIGFVS